MASEAVSRTVTNRRWVLASRPDGKFSGKRDARLEDQLVALDDREDGTTIVQVETLSIDAFIRTMLDEKAYHGAIALGDAIPALGYGTVLSSSTLKPGTRVMGLLGAQTVCTSPDAQLNKMPALPRVQPREWLGMLGLTTGITAWVGIYKVVRPPRKGETVVVSAAAGAAGSIAAQLAKLTGARVLGIAGGEAKGQFLTETLKLDGAIDYKADESLGAQLDRHAPDGVDFFFDCVGGATLDAVLERIRPKGRVVICGAVSQYSGNLNVGRVEGPSSYLKLAERGASMTGYNVMQYMWKVPAAIGHMLWLRARGLVTMHEHVEKGIGKFPEALEKLFGGGHMGKLILDLKDAQAVAPAA